MFFLFKIDAHHAYQAAKYFFKYLSNVQWQSDLRCVLMTVFVLHSPCSLPTTSVHVTSARRGTGTCCLIRFPSSQINMIRGCKQLLNQECSLCSHHFQSSQQSLTSDWTRPLGRAATTRALQKWNWSSKTTDHRLGTAAWLKSLLSPEVTVSATVHGHKLAQRTLTSINNFFFFNTKLRASTTKWWTSFLKCRGQQTNKQTKN